MLTFEQFAEHLQVSKEAVYRWLDRENIPAHKIGRQWRFQVSEVGTRICRESLNVMVLCKKVQDFVFSLGKIEWF